MTPPSNFVTRTKTNKKLKSIQKQSKSSTGMHLENTQPSITKKQDINWIIML